MRSESLMVRSRLILVGREVRPAPGVGGWTWGQAPGRAGWLLGVQTQHSSVCPVWFQAPPNVLPQAACGAGCDHLLASHPHSPTF